MRDYTGSMWIDMGWMDEQRETMARTDEAEGLESPGLAPGIVRLSG